MAERGVPGLRARMVGPRPELALLRTLLGRVAAEERPHLVTIYGDPGVGKSRLTREFVGWAEERDPPTRVLRGRCVPYGEGVTYWPLAEILKGHAGVLDSDPSDLALEKIRTAGRDLFTPEVVADPVRATAALAYAVGIVDPEVRFQDLEPRQVRAELHQAWRTFFSELASDGTVVVVIEDIHWADPSLLDLLEEVAERADRPALVPLSRPPGTDRVPPHLGRGAPERLVRVPGPSHERPGGRVGPAPADGRGPARDGPSEHPGACRRQPVLPRGDHPAPDR